MDDLVIFVHGTFAADKDQNDYGDRWWQHGSTTWRWIQSHLPAGISLPDDSTKLFHWSGANRQAERLAASTRLLAWLVELERRGQGYHLVGHSHGGSIIWETLISSEVVRSSEQVHPDLLRELKARKLIHVRYSRRKSVPGILAYPQVRDEIKLDGLRSWTTIGTPFLHYIPRRRRLVDGWPSPTFSLLAPKGNGLIDLALAVLSLLSVIGLISGLGVASAIGRPGVSIAPFALTFVGMLALVFVAFYFMSHRNFAGALMSREHASHRVIKRFAMRWLGLWAQSDEAIAALRSLTSPGAYDYAWLCLPSHIRPDRQIPKAISDELIVPVQLSLPATTVNLIPEVRIFVPLRVFITPAALVFNRWLSKRVGQVVTNILLRTAQGSDLPGAVLAYASPWPLPLEPPFGGLPDYLTERLELSANHEFARIGPVSREMLAAALLEGISLPELIKPGKLLINDKLLIHTSYLEDLDVLRLILLHISRMASRTTTRQSVKDDELGEWLDVTSTAVESRLVEFVRDIGQENQLWLMAARRIFRNFRGRFKAKSFMGNGPILWGARSLRTL